MSKGKQSELSLPSSQMLASTYFPTLAVSSALSGFYSLFGMGRGRSTATINTIDKSIKTVAEATKQWRGAQWI